MYALAAVQLDHETVCHPLVPCCNACPCLKECMEYALGVSAAILVSMDIAMAQVLLCKAELAAALRSICRLNAGGICNLLTLSGCFCLGLVCASV